MVVGLVIALICKQPADEIRTGSPVTHFVSLRSPLLRAEISPYGAALARLWFADHATSLVLGLPTAHDYKNAPDYSGAIVGPIAGRVSGAKTIVNGTTWHMDPNTPPDCLHSGSEGISKQKWDVTSQSDNAVSLCIRLAHGTCGLPGNRTVQVDYVLDDSDLTVTLTSQSDAPTPMNPTLHAYWSLDDAADLSTHRLQISSTKMCETSEALIPTGRVVDCSEQDHDFSLAKSPLTKTPLDGCFCLPEIPQDDLQDVMSLHSVRSGIHLNVSTNQPGLVLYTGQFLTPYDPPKDTPFSKPFSAIAIEAQGWPDAANNASFPQIIVTNGQLKQQITRFSLRQS